MEPIEIIGTLAGVLTLAIYIPQTIRTVRTHQTRDLSLVAFLAAVASGVLWTAYGIMTASPSMIATNSVVGICALIIVIVKLRGGKQASASDQLQK